jgi:ribosomal protein L37AE/L43A
VIEGAQCGEPIDLSEWSEDLDSRRARHLWHCDTCGVSFETTVRIAAA